MLTVEQCRKLLGPQSQVTDEEIASLRDQLGVIGSLASEIVARRTSEQVLVGAGS